jgi:hypothetical protein
MLQPIFQWRYEGIVSCPAVAWAFRPTIIPIFLPGSWRMIVVSMFGALHASTPLCTMLASMNDRSAKASIVSIVMYSTQPGIRTCSTISSCKHAFRGLVAACGICDGVHCLLRMVA